MKKKVLAAILSLVLMLLVFSACTAKSAAQAPASEGTLTCTVSIDCSTVLDADPELAAAVSADGKILDNASVALQEGSTVYDALVETGIVFDDSAGYVASINSLGGGDCGAMSGWLYSVNDEYAMVDCASYILEDGDSILWIYTCDGGPDVGATFE
ncbi:MAG: DUF4430 domain-containing protein [Christensenellaceae bacterium]|jgi:ABC-type transport system substrate-binding protein